MYAIGMYGVCAHNVIVLPEKELKKRVRQIKQMIVLLLFQIFSRAFSLFFFQFCFKFSILK